MLVFNQEKVSKALTCPSFGMTSLYPDVYIVYLRCLVLPCGENRG